MKNRTLVVIALCVTAMGSTPALGQTEGDTPPSIVNVTWEIARNIGGDAIFGPYQSPVAFDPSTDLAHELDIMLVTVEVQDPDFAGEDGDGIFYLSQTLWIPFPGYPTPQPPPFPDDLDNFFPDSEGFKPGSGTTLIFSFSFQIPAFSGENQAKLRGIIDYDVAWMLHIIVSNNQDPSCTVYGGGFIDGPCEEPVFIWDEFFFAVENPVLIAPNAPPFSDAGADQTVASGTLVTLDGRRTFDAFNQGFNFNSADIFTKDTLTYTWEWISGPVRADPVQTDAHSPIATVLLTTTGVYEFRLLADDNVNALPSAAVVHITVVDELPAKNPPVAIIEGPANPQPVGAVITLVSRSYDPDRPEDPNGLLLDYRWQQTNELGGPLESDELLDSFQPLSGLTSKTSTWQALTAGTFYFRLLVDDGDFRSNATFSVEVFEPETGGTSISSGGDTPTDSGSDSTADDGLSPPTAAGCGAGIVPLAAVPLTICALRRRYR